MNSYRWSVVTVKSIVTVPVKKACKSANVCSFSSFILITMARIMIDHGYQFRLKPRWIHAPLSDSYPIGQRSFLTLLRILHSVRTTCATAATKPSRKVRHGQDVPRIQRGLIWTLD